MWIKLLGSLLIIVAGTALGFRAAARYSERPRQIRQLISCISALQSHINYVAIPLPEALRQCTAGITGPVAELFRLMSALLADNRLTPQAAMDQALIKSEQLVFHQSEREILAAFSASLGSMNREEQHKALTLVQVQLSGMQGEAEKQCEHNVKMYRYLGICGSLALVIILV